MPGARPAAETSPSTVIEPPTPAIWMLPVLPPALSAEMRPPASTRLETMPSAARAVSSTLPPAAEMVPVLVTSTCTGLPFGPSGACRTALVTSTASRPSP